MIAAVLATIVLRARNRVYKKLEEDENVDADDDGIPDVYQTGDGDPATPPR